MYKGTDLGDRCANANTQNRRCEIIVKGLDNLRPASSFYLAREHMPFEYSPSYITNVDRYRGREFDMIENSHIAQGISGTATSGICTRTKKITDSCITTKVGTNVKKTFYTLPVSIVNRTSSLRDSYGTINYYMLTNTPIKQAVQK